MAETPSAERAGPEDDDEAPEPEPREVLMIDEVLTSQRLTLNYLRRLVADVAPTELFRQPAGIPNHPGWVLGHLAHSCQALGGELGLPPWLPEDWKRQFGTGSTPLAEPSAYPSRAELLAVLINAQRRLADRLERIGEPGLAAPLPDERHRSVFPTVGHAVLHILAGHTAVHVGQVSVWRRAAGYETLPEA